MTPEQHKIIDRTLGALGYLSFIGAGGLSIYSIMRTIVHNRSFGYIFETLFDIDEAGIIIYPLIGAGVVFLWARAIIRAGRKVIENE